MEKGQKYETKEPQAKKDWITPEIFDSPVIAVTKATLGGQGQDEGQYS